MVLAKMDR